MNVKHKIDLGKSYSQIRALIKNTECVYSGYEKSGLHVIPAMFTSLVTNPKIHVDGYLIAFEDSFSPSPGGIQYNNLDLSQCYAFIRYDNKFSAKKIKPVSRKNNHIVTKYVARDYMAKDEGIIQIDDIPFAVIFFSKEQSMFNLIQLGKMYRATGYGYHIIDPSNFLDSSINFKTISKTIIQIPSELKSLNKPSIKVLDASLSVGDIVEMCGLEFQVIEYPAKVSNRNIVDYKQVTLSNNDIDRVTVSIKDVIFIRHEEIQTATKKSGGRQERRNPEGRSRYDASRPTYIQTSGREFVQTLVSNINSDEDFISVETRGNVSWRLKHYNSNGGIISQTEVTGGPNEQTFSSLRARHGQEVSYAARVAWDQIFSSLEDGLIEQRSEAILSNYRGLNAHYEPAWNIPQPELTPRAINPSGGTTGGWNATWFGTGTPNNR